MKTAELAETLGLPPRQIRYMISEGIIPGANGLGRGVDGFDERHLAAGRRYVALKAAGHSSYEAKRLMAAERTNGRHIRVYERHPATLTIDAGVDPASIDTEALLAELAAALRAYVNSGKKPGQNPEKE